MSTMTGPRTVFFISDRTGITAEMLGNSLLTQFEDFQFQRVTIPFVDTLEKIDEAVRQVNATAEAQGRRPIVVSSVVSETMSEIIRR
ncbi:MAG TPA: kinase/pyrophosphorylase, partial [Casimicrobiaceae bacterium]|nr:kinase/pyrophosphorylase [Casimicrobiaceae bacterium]